MKQEPIETIIGEFPEQFPWYALDGVGSGTIGELGRIMSIAAENDLQTKERAYIGGLRSAMRILIETYDHMNTKSAE